MLCSYLELLAPDAATIRVVVGEGSGTARNLAERGAATILVIEPERVVYVKARADGAPRVEGPLARFVLRVEDVLEDVAADREGSAAVTSGITYAPPLPLDGREARAVIALLRGEG